MESKIFIDTDVIIDFLIDRQPYAISSSKIFDLADKKKINVCTSVLSLHNVHYIVRKILGEKKTREVIGEILEIVDVLSVSGDHIKKAIKSNFKDFEDAIQHSVALSDKSINIIVTRNIKDYKHSTIPVFDSDTYIKLISTKRKYQ